MCKHCRASLHEEQTDKDFGRGMYCRPDGLVVCCSAEGNVPLKQVHSLEAKSIKTRRQLVGSGNNLPEAFKQARDYYGNYNWLLIEFKAWQSINEEQRDRLIDLCRNRSTNESRGVGLVILKADNGNYIKILVEALRNDGDFLLKYPRLKDKLACGDASN
jgi:hypothetical protein